MIGSSKNFRSTSVDVTSEMKGADLQTCLFLAIFLPWPPALWTPFFWAKAGSGQKSQNYSVHSSQH